MKNTMVFCIYCGKNFTRKEHLERHLPSHTNAKPYRCEDCHISFVRKDLLQKHYTTYHRVQDQNAKAEAKKEKPIACTSCASSKTACDKKLPCGRCANKNLDCIPRFSSRSERSSGSSGTSTPDRVNCSEGNGIPFLLPRVQNPCEMDVDSTAHLQLQAQIQSDPYGLENWPSSQLPLPAPINTFDGMPATAPPMPPASNVAMDVMFTGNFEGLSNASDFNDYEMDMEMWHTTFTDPDPHYFLSPSAQSVGHLPVMDLSQPGSPYKSHAGLPALTVSPDQLNITSVNSENESFESKSLIPNFDEVQEPELIIAAEDAWPLASCTTKMFTGSCPRTATIHLQSLQDHTRFEHLWASINDMLSRRPAVEDEGLSITPLKDITRDKILTVAQTFLHKAVQTHSKDAANSRSSSLRSGPSFFVLPPANLLEHLLRGYVRSLDAYYSLVHGEAIDPNELLQDNEASTFTLLVLLMLAQGISAIPMAEARCLQAALTEICRISLLDIIERNAEFAGDPMVLRSALLLTIQGAWGGDAWHMNMSMGYRGMYLSMLKHAGMMEASRYRKTAQNHADVHVQWQDWQKCENKLRLVYNWVMVDQELSLFHDTAPVLTISDIEAPLPACDRLWRASTAEEWQQTRDELKASDSHSETRNLSDLFLALVHHDESSSQTFSHTELKLLLHPLQSILYHIQVSRFCSSVDSWSSPSMMLRLQEVHAVLCKWYKLCQRNYNARPSCATTRASLILYHLISLNAITNFPEIERLGRQVGTNDYDDLSARHLRCIYEPEKAIVHCGQVLRLIGEMPVLGRPPWWPAALYRAAMILWADGISRTGPNIQCRARGRVFAINLVVQEDPSVMEYVWHASGTPVLGDRDGNRYPTHRAGASLRYCMGLLKEGGPVRFADGIGRKLKKLLQLSRAERGRRFSIG